MSCLSFVAESTKPFQVEYGSTSVNYMAHSENTQFSNPMNVLSCSNPKRDTPMSSPNARSVGFALQFECIATSPRLSQYNVQDELLVHDPPTKKLRVLNFAEEQNYQTEKTLNLSNKQTLTSKEDIGNPILNGILFQQIFTFLNQV